MASLLAIVFTDVVESRATKRDQSLGRDSRERDRAYLHMAQMGTRRWNALGNLVPPDAARTTCDSTEIQLET